jgi:hypothetical protein
MDKQRFNSLMELPKNELVRLLIATQNLLNNQVVRTENNDSEIILAKNSDKVPSNA